VSTGHRVAPVVVTQALIVDGLERLAVFFKPDDGGTK
jgi:hypothetical protein